MVDIYYRAAQLVHQRAMDVFQNVLPATLVGAEIATIFALFTAIRLNTNRYQRILSHHFTGHYSGTGTGINY